MNKRILFVHTRELCYYSGSYFLQQMQKEVAKLGIESQYFSLGQDPSSLEGILGRHYDGVVDINSKLPYFVLEDDRRFLDVLDAPFYNYIVDHPLYHHPGLIFPLKDYHAIAIDHCHKSYMEKYYPHLQQVAFLPIGATQSRLADVIPYEKRQIPLLFLGTYESKDGMLEKFRALCRKTFADLKIRQEFYDLGMALLEVMLAGKESANGERVEIPMEEALAGIVDQEKLQAGAYGTRDFAVLMNYLYLIDKYVRNARRHKVLSYVADLKVPLTLVGEGWEKVPLAGQAQVRLLGAKRIEETYDLLADARQVLDVNPLFADGVHDRVTSAMINGCLCCSDMSVTADSAMGDGRHFCHYSNWNLDPLGYALTGMPLGQQEEMAGRAKTYAVDHYSWQAHAKKLLDLMQIRP